MNVRSIGIVMPVRNCLKYSQMAFSSLKTDRDHQWIIIDNASDDGTQEWGLELSRTHGNITYLRQSENIGVPRSWNLGIQECFKQNLDVCLIINNDLYFAPYTVDNLVDWIGVQGSGKFEFVSAFNIGNDISQLREYRPVHDVIMIPNFTCFVITGRTLKRVGLFDENFGIGYFEDNDYEVRLALEGIVAVSCLDAPVVHFGSRTIKEGGIDASDQQRQYVRNRQYFINKWKIEPEYERKKEVPSIFKRKKPRLLWIGDACVPTGFAKVTHNVLNYLKNYWDVHVLGVNYLGDPHDYSYPIYPARHYYHKDPFGSERVRSMVEGLKPDLVCSIQDPPQIYLYGKNIKESGHECPFLAYIPVDSECQALADKIQEVTDGVIFCTRFGMKSFYASGYRGMAYLIPHGVDRNLFFPHDKTYCRRKMGLEKLKDAFIFGNINRNNPRKRMDLTIYYFSRWISRYKPERDVYLYLHCFNDDTDLIGYNLSKLAEYYGVLDRVILPDKAYTSWKGIREDAMYIIYNALDVQISTTVMSGFELTHLEGMSCGIPQIVPNYAALSEWPSGHAVQVPCSSIMAGLGNSSVCVGKVPDEDHFIDAMQKLYESEELRKEYSEKGIELASQPEFNWTVIAQSFNEVFSNILEKKNSQQDDK